MNPNGSWCWAAAGILRNGIPVADARERLAPDNAFTTTHRIANDSAT